MGKNDKWLDKVEEELQNATDNGKMPDVIKVINAFRAYQNELEMQNKELKRSHLEISDFYNHYQELYNELPLGYFTLDKDGIIKNVNKKGAELLGLEEKLIINKWFGIFIPKNEQRKYYLNFADASEKFQTQEFELQLKRDEYFFYSHILIKPVHGKNNDIFHIIIEDITKRNLIEKDLEHHHALMESVIESSEGPIFSVDRNYNYMNFNSQHKALMKQLYDADIEIGFNILDYHTNTEDRKNAKKNIDLALKGKSFTIETYTSAETRNKRYFIISHNPVKNLVGTVIGVACYVQDFTDRKKMEEAFAKKTEELQTIIDSSRSLIFYKDKENRFLQVNKAFANILGLPKEQLEGKSLFDIFPKEQAEAYWKDDKEVIGSERPKYDIIESIQFKNSIHYVQTDKIPYRDEDGNIIGIIGFAVDITERKKNEETILKAQKEWEHTFDAVPDLISIVDKDYNILQVNQPMASRLGVKIGDCIGCKCYELIHDTHEPPSNCTHKYMLKDGLEHTSDFYEEKLGGYFLSSASPIYNENKELDKCVHVLRDITKIKIIEKELESAMDDLKRSNNELEQFAYVASHDLKEPLRMVSSFLQLLQQRYEGQLDADADEFIEYAVDGAKRMHLLIEDLLAYSRIMTKGNAFKELKMEDALSQALINLKISIEENDSNISHDPLPIISADFSQMIQLFQNLIGNAIKYRDKENPQIHISATKEDDHWLFSVKDNGIGIDQRHADRIFMIFKRIHTNTEYTGTGIGLAIAKRIVEKHGGQIWLEPEPGKGSNFCFTLPE